MNRRPWAFLAGLLTAKLLLSVALLRAGFVSVSGDDFMRALIALEWAKHPFLVSTEFDTASSLWLPLPFWLNGVALKAVSEPWLVPIAVNVALSLGGLLYLYGLARRLFDERTALLTIILIGILPWHVWLSTSGMAEIPLLFFLSAAFYYLVRWESDVAPRWALLASVAALGATMARPEGWLYVLPLTARFAAALSRRRWELVVAATLPWSFAVCWLGFNYVAYGEAWQFVQLSRRNFQAEAGSIDSLAVRLLQFPLLLAAVSLTLSVLLPPSLVRAWRRGGSAVRRYTALVGCGFGLLIGAGLLGLGTTSAPQRYVVTPLALFAPLLAGWCRHVAWPALGPRLAMLALLGYILANALFVFQFPREFQDEVRLARVLVAMREEGLLEPGALIASDRPVAAVGAGTRLGLARRVRLLADRWALQVLSGMPEAFVDRDWSVDGPAAVPDLGNPSVRVIALKTPALTALVPPRFAGAGTVGSYRLYAAGLTRERIPPAPPLLPTTRVHAEFGPLRLQGYRQDAWAAPRVVRLFFDWTRSIEEAEGVGVEVRLIGAAGPAAARTYRLAEHLPPGPRPQPIEVPVRFDEDFDVPAGRYLLGVAPRSIPDAGPLQPPGRTDPEVRLGPFYLIRSKREVLKKIFATTAVDPALLARVLLSL